jgi:hypothetical protein
VVFRCEWVRVRFEVGEFEPAGSILDHRVVVARALCWDFTS